MNNAIAHVRLGLALATIAFCLAFHAVGAGIKPGHFSVLQFISELNASVSSHALPLALFGFPLLGLLLAAFMIAAPLLVQIRRGSRAGWWLLRSQPIAFVSVAAFPCDLGCPIDGSFNQTMPGPCGVATCFAGALGLFLLLFTPPLQGQHPCRDMSAQPTS